MLQVHKSSDLSSLYQVYIIIIVYSSETAEDLSTNMKSDSTPVLTEGGVVPIIKKSSKSVKKLPKFVWTPKHRELLRMILTSVKNIMKKPTGLVLCNSTMLEIIIIWHSGTPL